MHAKDYNAHKMIGMHITGVHRRENNKSVVVRPFSLVASNILLLISFDVFPT